MICSPRYKRDTSASRSVCASWPGAASFWRLGSLYSFLLSLLLFRSNAHISCHVIARCLFSIAHRYRMGGGMNKGGMGGGMGGGCVSFVARVWLEVFPSCRLALFVIVPQGSNSNPTSLARFSFSLSRHYSYLLADQNGKK